MVDRFRIKNAAGWLRLYVFVVCFQLGTVITIGAFSVPKYESAQPWEVMRELSDDSLAMLYLASRMPDDGVSIDNRSGRLELSGFNMVSQDMFRVDYAEAFDRYTMKKQTIWWGKVIFFAWILPAATLGVLGLLIAWVLRGFQKKTIDNQ